MKFPRVLWLLWLALASGSAFCEDKPKPVEQDEFSGKTVVDQDMAYEVMGGRRFNSPRVGEIAAPFSVVDLETGDTVTLEQIRSGKPVVLVFGSYGCNVLREGMEQLEKLHREFGDRFAFAMIYIREAHSFDGFRPEAARAEDPRTMKERLALAEKYRAGIEVPFPIYVDSIDDRAATSWGAWPVRIFVLGADGKVLYRADTGPLGFDPGLDFVPLKVEGLLKHPDQFNEESLEDFLRTFP